MLALTTAHGMSKEGQCRGEEAEGSARAGRNAKRTQWGGGPKAEVIDRQGCSLIIRGQ